MAATKSKAKPKAPAAATTTPASVGGSKPKAKPKAAPAKPKLPVPEHEIAPGPYLVIEMDSGEHYFVDDLAAKSLEVGSSPVFRVPAGAVSKVTKVG